MFAKRVIEGAWKIWALADESGDCDLLGFLVELKAREREEVLAMLDLVAERGPQALPKKRCHDIDKTHRIFQFSAGQVRILWFYEGDRVILCSHAFLKKTAKTPKLETARAIAARKRCDGATITPID